MGVDLFIQKVEYSITNKQKSYYTKGEVIDVQLKCTTTKSIFAKDGVIKYDLEVKNYNDIVRRFNGRAIDKKIHPLILILFILPKDSSGWLVVTKKHLKLRKKAYWYYLDSTQPLSSNNRTIRITIPIENQVDLTTLPMLFDEFYSKKTLQDD